ncbi:MAG: dinitrogenase iron-molybdenum cofactor biosynthesis protein [Phycisphaerae bacterium]|nr:dinitrogenase iron-molybdenum cofactor biosynthesis protein [Phycisphaerae bacterium]
MKIAICSQSNNVQSNIDSRFGRTAFFAVYDDTVKQWEFITNNQNLQAAQGAGIQAAQAIMDADADALIASNVGPKAMAALSANGVAVFKINTGQTLEQALTEYQSGKLPQMQQANVEGHWV